MSLPQLRAVVHHGATRCEAEGWTDFHGVPVDAARFNLYEATARMVRDMAMRGRSVGSTRSEALHIHTSANFITWSDELATTFCFGA